MLIGFINVEHRPDKGILIIAGAIVLLSFGVFVLRFASSKFPSGPAPEISDLADTDKMA